MPAPVDISIRCPDLVGRAPYVDSLQRLVEQAQSGKGKVALVSGEAGIGKSRLIAEVRERAAASNCRVVQGNCFEPDRALPYAPLLDLLRGFAATTPADDIARQLAPIGPEVTRLLPELAPRISGVAPLPSLDPEQEKRRIVEALTSFFLGLASDSPLVVVFEDIHWSDDTSLDCLLMLARRIASHPALLILTYRSDEVHPGLRHFLADLDRARLAVEFDLGPLSVAEVDTMVRAIFTLPRPIRVDFLEALQSLTEGNPFFIEEVLHVLLATGGIFYSDGAWDRKPIGELHIPRSVQDAVGRRTARCSPAARDVLALAAVAGQRFDFTLLQALAHQSERALLDLMKELIAAGLVVETSGDQFAFRHALTRQAIYAELLSRERRALHRDIARALEQLYASALDTRLADLAYHYYHAGEWERALDYCRRAGDKALSLYSARAAIEHYTHAVDAAGLLGVPPLAAVHCGRGMAHETLGEFEAALRDFEHALTLARDARDGPAECLALMDLGSLWAGRDYQRTGEYFRQATELAAGLEDAALHARSLNRFGNWLVNTGQATEGVQLHREALAIFGALGDTHGIADTLDLLGMGSGIAGDTASAVRHYEQAIPIYQALGDTTGLIATLASHGVYASPQLLETTYSTLADEADCIQDSERALRLARQTGSLAWQAYAEFTLGASLSSFGMLGPALAHAQEARRIAEEIAHQQWVVAGHYTAAMTYLHLLAPDRALRHLWSALPLAQTLGSTWWIGNTTAATASAHLLLNELEQAEKLLDVALPIDRAPRDLPERRMYGMRGRIALAQERPLAALDIAERLLGSVLGDGGAQPIPWLLLLRGEALLALGRPDEALKSLLEAERGALARHERPRLWQVRVVLARAYTRAGDSAAAERIFAAARLGIQEMAATIDDSALHEHFCAAALATLPRERVPTQREMAKRAAGGLTAREREVAVLLARGHSNRAIADALVVSERTVETHVTNVLGKLGFTSRAQIAAWVVQHGLLSVRE